MQVAFEGMPIRALIGRCPCGDRFKCTPYEHTAISRWRNDHTSHGKVSVNSIYGDPAFIGATITELRVDERAGIVLLFSDGRAVHLEPEGECCSISYIGEVYGCQVLPARLLSFEDADGAPDDTWRGTDDLLSYYAYALRLESDTWGECTITIQMRNESNGYYGGQLVWGGLDDPANFPQCLPVVESWSAD